MINWEDSFNEIRADREHGATYLYRQALTILGDAASQNQIQDSSDIGNIIRILHFAQPAMAPMHFLAEKLESLSLQSPDNLNSRLAALVKSLERDSELAHGRIIGNFEQLNLRANTILLHSRSGTVQELIRGAVKTGTKLLISEGRPGMEGLNLAGELVIDGYAVKTFVDDARAEVVKEADIIIVGADWISERDFTNKIGTYTLALVAREMRRPIYVAADATKFAQSRFRIESPSLKGNRQSFYQDILFEESPNSLITTFVTDLGLLNAEQVASRFGTSAL